MNSSTILFIFSGFLLAFGVQAEISPVFESKASLTDVAPKKVPKWNVDWATRSTKPMADEYGEPNVTIESEYGFQYKFAKRQKISLKLVTLHEFDHGPNGEDLNKSEMGDTVIKYSDKRLKDLTEDTAVIFTHKAYIPTRERSIDRTMITKYKGWAVVSHQVSRRWSLVGNLIPVLFAFREPVYKEVKPNGKIKYKSNALYDLTGSAQAVYAITDEWYASAEFGFNRRENLRYKGAVEAEDAFITNLALVYIYSDQIDVTLTLAGLNPANEFKFNRMRPFNEQYTTAVLETSISAF